MEIERYETPLSGEPLKDVLDLWESVWQGSSTGPQEDHRPLLEGAEVAQNRDIIYLTRREGKVVGTTQLTISRSVPALGGLGGVSTNPAFRRSGIATVLGKQTCDEFGEIGGKALFLGTVNPAAARIYRRLAYRKIPSSIVYAYIVSGDTPEQFLLDYFEETGPTTVREGNTSERLSMIPLLCAPNDWQVLDANVGMFTTRYAILRGALFLYPRYAALRKDGRGSWFAAHTDDLRLVGLSSARLGEDGLCRVDGFTHDRFRGAWSGLMQAAVAWGAARGAAACSARLCVEDEEKRTLFENMGFRETGAGDEFDMDGRSVPAVNLERPASDAI